MPWFDVVVQCNYSELSSNQTIWNPSLGHLVLLIERGPDEAVADNDAVLI